jgi:hypothetical protein
MRKTFHSKILLQSNDRGRDGLKKNYLPIETNLRHREKDEGMKQSERPLEHEHNEEMKSNTTKMMEDSLAGDSMDILYSRDHDKHLQLSKAANEDRFV